MRVMNLSLFDAFGKFGAKPSSRFGSLSAIAADGAMVINCRQANFSHPAPGVLRYETRLSSEQAAAGVLKSLGEHLGRAREGELPVRMVVTFAQRQKTAKTGGYYVRADLIGKVADFDGDHFAIDFTRLQEPVAQSAARRRK
jgi:hypothetical protein